MTRAAIYARFSTDLQTEKSIEDQIALCRTAAARDGLSVIGTYQDSAASGASLHGRPGLQRLLADARAKGFDVLLVEAFDRIARRQADSHGIYVLLTFLEIEIRAVHDGVADPVTFGLRAMVAQMQRDDGAKKVRRGMAGVVREGRHAGGRAYGYALVPGKPGELVIDESEASIVREVFAAYVSGKTPRQIAADLNRRGVAAPRGARWNASTLNGNRSRGHGFLLNYLYAGRIVWNKVRMVKDPDTGKRVSRPNPPSEHQAIDVPCLRIVDEATWMAAQAIKQSRGTAPAHKSRKPRHLLSGLLRCGCCGAGVTIQGHDRHGRARVQCTAVRESGTCSNVRKFYMAAIDQAVLAGLKRKLAEPKYLTAYVKEYNMERRRLAGASVEARSRLERRAAEIDREHKRAIDALLKSHADPEPFYGRIRELEQERDGIRAELGGLAVKPEVITLHPTAIERYRGQIEQLEDVLARGAASGDDELIRPFRALVAAVIVRPIEPRGFELEIRGRLAALTGSNAFPNGALGATKMVAEEGLEPPTHGL
jgi:site-specific DNA recombinase